MPYDKETQKLYMREYRKKNKDKLKGTSTIINAGLKKRNQEYVDRAKNNPCTDCGGVFHPCAMDFDHLEDKVDNISTMVQNKVSLVKLQREIDKCELVCAICHRIRTFNRTHARLAK